MSVLGKTSVIIPVKEGDDTWMELLNDLTSNNIVLELLIVSPHLNRTNIEFNTELSNLKFIYSLAGRAVQLNTGAQHAKGEFLWFLHADSRLPKNSVLTANNFSENDLSNTIYYFNLRFLPDGPMLTKLNEIGANIRSRLLGIPFGDQGFFIKRNLFFKTDMYNETVTLGEDHLFIWNCRNYNIKIKGSNADIYTSARKYKTKGWLLTTSSHLFITFRQILLVFYQRLRTMVYNNA